MSFFAGLLSLLSGGTFMLLWSVPRAEIGPRFHRLVTYLSLIGWSLILLMVDPTDPLGGVQFGLALAIALVGFMYLFSLREPGRLPPGFVYATGVLLILSWYGTMGIILESTPVTSASLGSWWYGIQLILSAAVLGAIVDAMICGHWYLVNTGLSLRPIRRVSLALAAALLAKLVLLAGILYVLATGRPLLFERVVYHFPVLFWVRVLVGLGGGLLFNGMSWKALDYDNTQAATGILYACITWIVMGEFSAFYLTIQTGVPL